MRIPIASLSAFALILALSAAASAVPQGPGAKKAGTPPSQKKDPQAAVEPRSTPGPGQKFLATMVGDWEVAKAFFPRNGGEPSRQKGTCRQTMIQGGRFLQSEFTFGEGERQTTGLGLIGFEPETSTFTSVWIDSRQTRMSMRSSRRPFDGKTIELFSGSLKPPAKPARVSKTLTTVESEGGKIIHRQFSVGSEGAETLMMELVMTRAGAH